MAGRKKTNKKPGRGGRIAMGAFAALLLALALLAGGGVLNASVVRVRRAEATLPDLPPSFEGVTLLYASDIDLCGLNTAEKSGALFHRLQSLRPDILLLGGDYSSATLLEFLNRPEDSASGTEVQLRAREDFFHYIASFQAPLGKYAIAAPEDGDRDGLARLMAETGIHPLFDKREELRAGGDSLWLAGICSDGAALNSAGGAFHRGECVIAAAYSPQVLPLLLTGEASDGGQWADLVLCGHTHGGQVRLFGRTALSLTRQEREFPSGWSVSNGLPILVTQGVGCEGLNLRLGTRPEVWLITLRRASASN